MINLKITLNTFFLSISKEILPSWSPSVSWISGLGTVLRVPKQRYERKTLRLPFRSENHMFYSMQIGIRVLSQLTVEQFSPNYDRQISGYNLISFTERSIAVRQHVTRQCGGDTISQLFVICIWCAHVRSRIYDKSSSAPKVANAQTFQLQYEKRQLIRMLRRQHPTCVQKNIPRQAK